MGISKDLLDLAIEEEKQVEETLQESIQQELEGNLSPECAQALIDTAVTKIIYY